MSERTRTAAGNLVRQLVRALAARGEVTIRLADVGGYEAFTQYDTNTINLDDRLSFGRFVGALAHELTHLVRGKVDDPGQAAAEERQVRRETAELLIPAVPVLRSIPRQWTPAELAYAARGNDVPIDLPTVRDGFNPQTGGIPTQRGHLHVVEVLEDESVA